MFTISSVKVAKPLTYTMKDTLGEAVVSGNLLRARAAIECTWNLSYRASTQEEEKSSIGQVERLQ